MTQINEKRSSNRLQCGDDYYYSASSAGSRIGCVLKNLSVTGACIESAAPLAVGEPILLHICRDVDTAFKATIVWKREDSYGVLLNLETEDDFNNITEMMNNFNLSE